MAHQAEAFEIALSRRNTLCIRDADGLTLEVVEGCLWITQDLDTTDYIAKAGQSLEIERAGLTLVSACRAARIRLRSPGTDCAPRIEFDRDTASGARNRRAAVIAIERVRAALAFFRTIATGRPVPQ